MSQRLSMTGHYPGPRIGGVSFLYAPTGEFRAPMKGEYYLSGAIIAAYLAPNSLTSKYWIARPIPKA